MCQYITVHCLGLTWRGGPATDTAQYVVMRAAHVGLCNSFGPTRCPAARQPNRRAPPRTTACARQASGDDPRASKGPPRRQHSRAPRNARQSGGEAQPGGCAIRVRRPPPSSEIQRPPAGRNSVCVCPGLLQWAVTRIPQETQRSMRHMRYLPKAPDDKVV